METINNKSKNQYHRNYYEKRQLQKYCGCCKVYYGLKFKHLKSIEHKINLAIDLKIDINLI